MRARARNAGRTAIKPLNNNATNRPLKILKEKLYDAGAYAGRLHNGLIDEVLEALDKACEINGSLTLGKRKYDAGQFLKIAEDLSVEELAKAVNSLILRKGGINNRELYILWALAQLTLNGAGG